MIKAIIFDCFGVLYADAGLIFFEKYVPNFVLHKDELMDISKAFDLGYSSIDEYAQAVTHYTPVSKEKIISEVFQPQQRNEELIKYMTKLRSNYKVGLLSNTGKGGMEPFFSADERRELFDVTVLSSEVGIVKPNPEIFKVIANKLNVDPTECVMIDDRQVNIEGAEAVGMQAILYKTTHDTISTLNKLKEKDNA